MTNGGLQTIRSNGAPATGSRKLPGCSATLAMLLSWALKEAKWTARGLLSIPRTWLLCRAARKAWTPPPVPRSSAEVICRRTVIWASSRELALTSMTSLRSPASSPGQSAASKRS